MMSGNRDEPDGTWPPPSGRRQEIGARLDAIRTRLAQLSETGNRALSGQLEAAQRHEADAQACAAQALAASLKAFCRAAEAHERAARSHERIAAAGIGDTGEHEQQTALHRASAAADWQRAEHTLSLLVEAER